MTSAAGYATASQVVQAGDTIAIDLAQETTLSGTVTDGDGHGLKVYLRLSDASGRTWIGGTADDGTYSIDSLPAGVVDAWIYDDIHRPAHVSGLDLSLPANRTLNVPLADDGASLAGTVSNSDGVPIASAAVSMVDADQHVIMSAYADQAGHYVLGPLPAGALGIRTEVFGLPPLTRSFTIAASEGSYTLDMDMEAQIVDPAAWRPLTWLPSVGSGGQLVLIGHGSHPTPLPAAPAARNVYDHTISQLPVDSPSTPPAAADDDETPGLFNDVVTGSFGLPFPSSFEFPGGQYAFYDQPPRWCQAWQDAYDAAQKSSHQLDEQWKKVIADYSTLQGRNLNEVKYSLSKATLIGAKAVQSLSGLTGHFGKLANPPAIPTQSWDKFAFSMKKLGDMNSVKGMLQDATRIPGLKDWASRRLAAMEKPDGMGGKLLADMIVGFGKNGADVATNLAAAYRSDLKGKALSDAQDVAAMKWTAKFSAMMMDCAYKAGFDFPIIGGLVSITSTVKDFVKFNEEMKTQFQGLLAGAMNDYTSSLDLYGTLAIRHAVNLQNVKAAAQYCRDKNDTDPKKPLPQPPDSKPVDTKRPNGVRPKDPNDMLTIGYGPENWVRADSGDCNGLGWECARYSLRGQLDRRRQYWLRNCRL